MRLLQQKYHLYAADLEARVCTVVDDIESILVSFDEDAFKSSLEYTKVVIPELGAVYTEEDYAKIVNRLILGGGFETRAGLETQTRDKTTPTRGTREEE